jgi:branched-subunit amino acid transport protein
LIVEHREVMSDPSTYIAVLLAAAATNVWRFLGVAVGARLDPRSRVIEWVGAIAFALIAALIARLILLPAGPLASTPLAVRVAAVALALLAFRLSRGGVMLGATTGAAVLAALIAAGRLTGG